ncbi:MAG TPA: serine/threonine protein kinase [Nocardioidaceae bacterium]|nr:serine/threonine protein kinase [Nocardioidaceae bacterium]
MRRTAALIIAALVAAAVPGATGQAAERTAPARPHDVMFVGNNWDGTATIIDAHTHRKIQTINTIPDKAERMAEIAANPDKLAFYLAIQQAVGEGHDQYTDDMFTTNNGRLVAVSRPSFADVVGIDLATNEIRWRFPMEGYRADHMGISPDGRQILVSDSTANKVHELDIRTGEKLREFPSGDTPHENNYSRDGERIFHASIGRVYTPIDQSALGPIRDAAKGDRRLQIVDNDTFEIVKQWDIGEELAEAGYPGMSSAVRPMAIAPGERYAYLQVSFFHGFVEFDLLRGKVRRIAHLPDRTDGLPKEQYVLDSAHHGLAINDRGTKLCAAGTMDDYAAIVNRKTFRHRIVEVGSKPYWSTNGPDGDECWVSVSGGDKVVVIDYRTAEKLRTIRVGDHPQRVRAGYLADGLYDRWTARR